MSESERRRIRRRRKVVRGVKKTFINLVFAPARIPKIRQDTLDILMRVCEGAAVCFVAALVMYMAMPQIVPIGVAIFTGIVFAGLLGAIKLSDYQEKIEQYRYYGFRI